MVKIKPARRRPLAKPMTHQRTPVRKVSRPSRPLHSAQKRSPKARPFQQKIVQFVWLLVGLVFVCFLAIFVAYRSIISIALDDSSTTTVVLAPQKVDDTVNQVVFGYLSAEQNDSFIALLPGTADMIVPGGYGHYRLSAVYPLLQLEKKDNQFKVASFSRGLGRVVDAVYGADQPVKNEKIDTGVLLRLIMQKTIAEKKLPTSLIKLWFFSKQGIPVVTVQNLSELPGLVSQKETAVLENSQECPIGVLNASTQSGTAGLLSTLFEQSGLITIRTSSYPEIEPVTTIYTAPNSKCAAILEVVKKSFVQLPKIEVSEAMVTQYRAPIVIVIGEDFQ